MSVSNKTKSFITNGKVLLMIRNMIYVSALCLLSRDQMIDTNLYR